ncbi:YraN family protein [Candidatus Daviesbacteria bacterium]|nr:YraN family protein [Candidatus Daviesbacteria bacterium]
MNTTLTGGQGEDLACEYLKKIGYKIVARNYRIRGGEIDIVAREGDYLVFVEVKARYSREFGPPAESITFWKIKFLKKTALFYVQKINWGDKPYRIDVVTLDFADDKTNPKVELIKNITS